MRHPFVGSFSLRALITLLALSICSKALPVTYCSPELVGTSNSTTSIYMSNGVCADACRNTAVFAVILGTVCWCSNIAPATQLDTSECNSPCPGYPYDSCGNVTGSLYAYFNLGRGASGTAGVSTASSTPVTSRVTSNLATADPFTVAVTTSAGSTFIITSSSSSSAAASSAASSITSSIASSRSATSASSFTQTDTADIALYLQTAIPASDRSQSSNACFLNSAYSYYSTPTWYSEWPTQVQSYYSSSAQGATAACTLSAAQLRNQTNHSSGLSTGAKAGIAVGVIIGVLIIAALLFLCLKRRNRRRRADAIASDKADLEHEKAAIPATTYANTNSHYPTPTHYPATKSDDDEFTALPAVPASAHMQATHPAFIGAAAGRHQSDSIQSTPSTSDLDRNEHLQGPSKPWVNYANQRTRSEMSEDQQFFPALQQQNPYQLDPELDFTNNNQYTVPRRPVGGVGQTVHAGGTSGGFGFSDHNTGYESGGERSWYHAR